MKKALIDCRHDNLVLHAVLLLRTVNKYCSKDWCMRAYSQLSKEELVEYIEHFHDPQPECIYDEEEDYLMAEMAFNRQYSRSCTEGDYSPSHPWDAPGMSIHDFM